MTSWAYAGWECVSCMDPAEAQPVNQSAIDKAAGDIALQNKLSTAYTQHNYPDAVAAAKDILTKNPDDVKTAAKLTDPATPVAVSPCHAVANPIPA